MPDWVVVAVDVPDIWPSPEATARFRKREFILRPGEGEVYPDASLLRESGESYEEAATLIYRFLSALCWVERIPLVTKGHSGGTNRTRIGGRPVRPSLPWVSTVMQPREFKVPSLPESVSSEGELALALYREALGLNHETYQFLGFFKILNIRYANGKDQENWINKNLDKLRYPTLGRVQELQQSQSNIGQYLYRRGRNAVAHANAPPTVDPDRLDHTHQFNLDLPVIRELAEYFIETELGVPR